MKVVIKSKKIKFFIILPTALVLNRLSVIIATKIIKTKFPSIDISTEDFMKLVFTIKNYKRNHKHWEVVNIKSDNGDIVYINL